MIPNHLAQTTLVLMVRLLIAAALLGGLLAAVLFFFQRRLIYHPRSYLVAPEEILRDNLPEGTARVLRFSVDGHRQCAYLLRSADAASTAPLWVFFGGNASLALDWLEMAEVLLPCTRGILLMEYPGYGVNEGAPCRPAIRATARRAFEEAAAVLGESPAALATHTSVLGVSLGCATALEFALDFPVRTVVLLAPFSSLLEMARMAVGWPLCYVLRDRYDNIATLGALVRQRPDLKVYLFHGDRDRLVPVTMGRAIARHFPQTVHYVEIQGADHETIVDAAFPAVRAIVCTGAAAGLAASAPPHPLPE
jgi:pimeloyl-ACP methyl ester carboxylesterase